MKERSEKSLELYNLLRRRGYQEELCFLISQNLNTDFTAKRMIGYLKNFEYLPVEEVVDEMLSILSDRDRIMKKIEAEHANASITEFMNSYYPEDEEI